MRQKEMFSGFEKIVEERIKKGLKKGDFDNLSGAGRPLLNDEASVPEEFRMAYKILKNAGCVPPEIELKKEMTQIRDIMAGMEETAEKYQLMKKLNFLIMRFNSLRNVSADFEIPQEYMEK